MTQCNYCSLQLIRDNAKKNNLKVTILSDATWGMDGKNIYVHSDNIDITKLQGGEDGEREQYRKSWMMEIPNQCCC